MERTELNDERGRRKLPIIRSARAPSGCKTLPHPVDKAAGGGPNHQ